VHRGGGQETAETIFTLDGEKHHYFNPRERWQRLVWPSKGEPP